MRFYSYVECEKREKQSKTETDSQGGIGNKSAVAGAGAGEAGEGGPGVRTFSCTTGKFGVRCAAQGLSRDSAVTLYGDGRQPDLPRGSFCNVRKYGITVTQN